MSYYVIWVDMCYVYQNRSANAWENTILKISGECDIHIKGIKL